MTGQGMGEFQNTYVILEEIGKGGGGTVFKAYHKRLQKEVVLKKMHSSLKNMNARAETDILKNLKHAYLPQVLDFLEEDGEVYTVMDYIQGKSLKEYLDEGRAFTQEEIILWFKQLCEALQLLHTQKPPIIHGDIKPANIMLTPDGNICLIDFNISGVFEGEDAAVSGYTPGYASPEQIRCYQQAVKRQKEKKQSGSIAEKDDRGKNEQQKDSVQTELLCGEKTEMLESDTADAETQILAEEKCVTSDSGVRTEIRKGAEGQTEKTAITEKMDERSDIYSLGATIFHLLAGRRLEASANNLTVMEVMKAAPKVSEPLAAIVTKCVTSDPAERYQSVSELYHALQNIYKSNRQYQKLLLQQRMIRITLCVAVVAFLIMSYYGRSRMQYEKDARYLELTASERAYIQSGETEQLEVCYNQAVLLYPERAEAYQIRAEYYYQNEAYEDTIQFLMELAVPYVEEGSGLANLYLLMGDSYFELEQYDLAEQALKQAEENDPTNVAIYRELAAAQARAGKLTEAEETIRIAATAGLADDGISYINGELAYAKKNIVEADKCFERAIQLADDDYLRMRSYLMRIRIRADAEHTEENCGERVELLTAARNELPEQYENAILEQLAQAYIDLADLTEETEPDMYAIETLQEIIAKGWGSYVTHQNLVVLYQKHQMFAEELEELDIMQELYGEDYRIYKYRALMEVSIQTVKDSSERSYEQFQEYYLKAEELYQSQKKGNQSDAQMQALEQLYQDMIDGGWL